MKVITCTGYYGTGSSAITDFFSEFENVCSLSRVEFRFLYDPSGVSDLEYNLVENHNRHNSGHALKKYQKLVDFYAGNKIMKRYEPFFQNHWKETSYKYIEELKDFEYHGWWQFDLLDRGTFFYYRKLLINKILKKTIWKNKLWQRNSLPNEITYCSRPTYESFLNSTKNYVKELLSYANSENKEFLMVDQIVPSSNIARYTKFFDDIKVFLVERDPRDIYILEKKVWNSCIVAAENVEVFCKWYKYTRAHRKTEQFEKNVKLIYFEDLIYNYDKTTKEIMEWTGLKAENHIHAKEKFNPNISQKGTKSWEKYTEFADDVKYIEKELSEYLYKY